MWIPQENKDGYDAGSAMTYAGNLKGRLMLYYGTADNNVHPSNIDAADPGAAAGRQELRGPGRPGPGALRHQPAADDGVLHREPGAAEVIEDVVKDGYDFLPSPRWGEGRVPGTSKDPLTPTLSPAKPGERETKAYASHSRMLG